MTVLQKRRKSGEKQQIAIGSVYALGPKVYIFDEPSANLDYGATKRLAEIMEKLKHAGYTIFVVEHRFYYLRDLIDRAFLIQNGKIEHEFTGKQFCSLPEETRISYGLRTAYPERDAEHYQERPHTKDETHRLKVHNLGFAYKKGPNVFQNVSFEAHAGNVIGILGHNGAGKTTLLSILTGLLKQQRGEVCFDGHYAARTGDDGTVYYYRNVRTQAAMVTLDYDGNVLAMVGGLGEKTKSLSLNRAYSVTRQTGSTIKPIGAYALGIEYGLVNWSTMLNNSPLYLKQDMVIRDEDYCRKNGLMGLTGLPILLALAFFIVGIAKGSVLNTCTILVSGNSSDRTRGMNTMHACYACGALLCPFLISAAARVSTTLAVLALAALGLVLWLVYLFTPMAGRGAGKKEVTDWSFLRSTRFWLLTGLLFFQNAAEQSVVGWMVTYFKDSGIIAGTLAAYTVTVMWGATLVGRLLIAFVFPLRQPRKAMVVMGVSCTIFYILLVQARSQGAAIALLFAFAFAMAGMNPTAVASAGKMTTVTSMGIMLPVASSGAILMPWVIGKVAESAGLAVGMATNIVPCVGLIIFAILVSRMREE